MGSLSIEIVNFLIPDVSVDSELLGVVVFCVFLVGFGLTITLSRRELPQNLAEARVSSVDAAGD